MVVFIDGSGQRHLVDVRSAEGDVTPGLVDAAREVVSKGVGTSALRYAVTFDGYLTTDGKRGDAAFVEAGERGRPEGLLFAQRYRVRKRTQRVERVGQPQLLQALKNLLT